MAQQNRTYPKWIDMLSKYFGKFLLNINFAKEQSVP